MTQDIISPPCVDNAADSVVISIPAYNEETTIANIVEQARGYADDVLVVDDGSTDHTADRAEAAGATVVRHETNQGYGSALQTIFTEADRRDVEHLVIIDADGQHDPRDIEKLVEAQRTTEAEIVIGSRFAPGAEVDAPLYRRFGLSIINTLTNLSLRFAYATPRITDTQSGFRVYNADAIETMSQKDTLSKGMDISIDILFAAAEAGHEFAEIPIDISYDVEDANTHHPITQGAVLLINTLSRLYHERPAQLLNFLAVVFIFIGSIPAVAILSGRTVMQTVPVVIVVLLLAVGAMLSGTALILERWVND
jgi:glycosyltransferase involved in cell wall biosynthesis